MRIGKYDVQIIEEIENSQDGYFNLSGFSRREKASKGAIKYALDRLLRKKIITKKTPYTYTLNQVAQEIKGTKRVLKSPRGVVRKQKIKSIHAIDVFIDVEVRNIHAFIEKLKPERYFKSYPKNWTQHNLIFADGTRITIKPHTTSLHIPEAHGKTWEEADNNVRDRVFMWLSRFEELNIAVGAVYVDYSHFANINSLFAESIEKRLGSFEYKTQSGAKIWIDYSTGDREIETDNRLLAEQLETFTDELNEGRKLSDIDDIIIKVDKIERSLMQLTESHIKTTKNLELQTKILELYTKTTTINSTGIKEYTG